MLLVGWLVGQLDGPWHYVVGSARRRRRRRLWWPSAHRVGTKPPCFWEPLGVVTSIPLNVPSPPLSVWIDSGRAVHSLRRSWTLGRIAALARCGLLLQMSCLPVCLSVCVCSSRPWTLQKRLSWSLCHLGADSCGLTLRLTFHHLGHWG